MLVNETLYTFLLQKKAETVIAEAGILPETKVIERPSSIGVIAPDKIRIKGFYVLGGGALAFIIAFVRFVWYRKNCNFERVAGNNRYTSYWWNLLVKRCR